MHQRQKKEIARKYYSKALSYYRIINNAPRAKRVEDSMKIVGKH